MHISETNFAKNMGSSGKFFWTFTAPRGDCCANEVCHSVAGHEAWTWHRWRQRCESEDVLWKDKATNHVDWYISTFLHVHICIYVFTQKYCIRYHMDVDISDWSTVIRWPWFPCLATSLRWRRGGTKGTNRSAFDTKSMQCSIKKGMWEHLNGMKGRTLKKNRIFSYKMTPFSVANLYLVIQNLDSNPLTMDMRTKTVKALTKVLSGLRLAQRIIHDRPWMENNAQWL